MLSTAVEWFAEREWEKNRAIVREARQTTMEWNCKWEGKEEEEEDQSESEREREEERANQPSLLTIKVVFGFYSLSLY